MMIIKHVCNINDCWVKPQDIKGAKTLILGSFNPYNPNGGNADYYYGRSSNYFWKVIASLLAKKEDFFTGNLENKLEIMEHYKFCFSDVISAISITNKNNDDKIVNQFIDDHILKDFTDSKLFTTNHKKEGVIVERTYNIEVIDLIKQLHIKKVIHTMGRETIKSDYKTKPVEKKLGVNGFQGYIETIKSSGVCFEPISYSPSQYAVHRGKKESYLPKLTKWIKENLEINNK